MLQVIAFRSQMVMRWRQQLLKKHFSAFHQIAKVCNHVSAIMMSTIGGGGGGGGAAAGHAPSGAALGKRVQVVARVRAHLPGETVDSDLNVSGNGCKITLVPPAKSKSDRRTEFLFDDVFVPDCRPEDL